MSFSILKTIKREVPVKASRFIVFKDAILGQKYELSVVFIGKEKIKKLNKKYRNKDSATDILSFPLEKNLGEIYINLDISEKKAKLYGRKLPNYLEFLFIHGLVHLKGMGHGSKMENVEKKFRKKFNV